MRRMSREEAVQYMKDHYSAATLESDPEWVDEMVDSLMESGV